MNILILVESGVGKSTFINGFVNYLTFDTLADAEAHDGLVSLIASSFNVVDAKFKSIKVETGVSDNETFGGGQSATQASTVYVFPMAKGKGGKVELRIIDTP